MDQAGYNGIRGEHIEEVTQEILKMGNGEVSQQDFDRACWNCNIDPSNFTQADLERLQEKLNE
jgi:hypothetical protein